MVVTTSFHVHISIPSPPSLPLLGNEFALCNERLELLLRISQEFGEIGAFHFGPWLVPVPNAPELVRQVLVDKGATFEKTATVSARGTSILGNGIFLSEGEEHLRQRKLLAPLSQYSRVQDYAETMITYTERVQKTWNDGKTMNFADEMMHLTLRIISQVLFGADVSGKENRLGDVLVYTFRHFADVVTNPLRLPQSWQTPGNQRAHQVIDRINRTIYHMIEKCEETVSIVAILFLCLFMHRMMKTLPEAERSLGA